jgi:hypothetical protein
MSDIRIMRFKVNVTLLFGRPHADGDVCTDPHFTKLRPTMN